MKLAIQAHKKYLVSDHKVGTPVDVAQTLEI